MRKNVASQVIAAQLVSKTDGSAVTSGTTTVYYTIDGGVQGTAAATPVHEGNGCWTCALAQAETNGNHIAFTFVNSSAVTATINVYTISYDPHDTVRLGITALPNAAAEAAGGLITRGTGTGQITLASGAVTVGTNSDKTGYSLTQAFPTNFASLAITVGGAVTVGTNSDKTGYSLTQAFPSNFSAMSITAGGIVKADLDTIKTQTVTCSGGVTIPAATLASTTNITAGTITTVTNLTNAPTAGDLTATMKASVNTEVDTALADIHLDHLLAVDYDPAVKPGVATALLNELVENDGGVSRFTVNALEEVWSKAMAELSAVPGVTGTMLQALSWIFSLARNKIEQTATTQTLYKDDGTTALAASTVSDNGTTFTRGEFA